MMARNFLPPETRHEPSNPIETLRHYVHVSVDGMDAVVERIVRPAPRHHDGDLRCGGRLCLVPRDALAISAQRHVSPERTYHGIRGKAVSAVSGNQTMQRIILIGWMLLGWAVLIVLAGLASLGALHQVSHLIVKGPWHDLFATLFVMVVWPVITVVFRFCVKHDLWLLLLH
jgi:hypothetical protein